MFPKKDKIWLYSKILDRFVRTLIGRQLLFLYRKYFFLCTGMMSACSRIEGKVEELLDLLT